jgi:hypothetical protein
MNVKYQIHGYDKYMSKDYIEPTLYNTYEAAFAKAHSNHEWVVKSELEQEYFWQATSRPDPVVGFMVVTDTPCKTIEDCERQANETFGPEKYTVKKVHASKIKWL